MERVEVLDEYFTDLTVGEEDVDKAAGWQQIDDLSGLGVGTRPSITVVESRCRPSVREFLGAVNSAALSQALDPSMSQVLLEDLDPTNRVLKRAQYEAFAFSLLDGDVQVRNESHQDPPNHDYRVTIVDGVPTACECPADRAYDTPCKHRVAIAIRPRILDLVTKIQAVTDGGTTLDEQYDSAGSDQCECDTLEGEFPCWNCVRTGRKKLPEK